MGGRAYILRAVTQTGSGPRRKSTLRSTLTTGIGGKAVEAPDCGEIPIQETESAGAVVPARYCRDRMVTVAVNQFIFKQPVRVGDILSFFAHVTRIGNTSITVQVEVFAERFGTQGQYVKVTEASLTYVAIGLDGRPQQIPREGWQPPA